MAIFPLLIAKPVAHWIFNVLIYSHSCSLVAVPAPSNPVNPASWLKWCFPQLPKQFGLQASKGPRSKCCLTLILTSYCSLRLSAIHGGVLGSIYGRDEYFSWNSTFFPPLKANCFHSVVSAQGQGVLVSGTMKTCGKHWQRLISLSITGLSTDIYFPHSAVMNPPQVLPEADRIDS